MGSTIGSYFGLVFLIAAYSSIGIFTLHCLTTKLLLLFWLFLFASFFILGLMVLATVVPSLSQLLLHGMQDHFKYEPWY
jgi:ABC-2 type transport system permease protein